MTVYAVAVVEMPDDKLLEYVREPRPLNMAAGNLVPVVNDAYRRELHYLLKIPLLGNAVYEEFKKSIKRQLHPTSASLPLGTKPTSTVSRAVGHAHPEPHIQKAPVGRLPSVPASEAPAKQIATDGFTRRIPPLKAHTPTVEVPINAEKADDFLGHALARERLGLALLAGLTVALVTGFVWGVVNGNMGIALDWTPFVGLGYLVGVTMRTAGKGLRLRFGIAGALLALMGCLLCRAVSVSVAVALQTAAGDPIRILFHTDLETWARLAWDGANWFNVLALAPTVWQGYYFAFRRISRQEISFLADGELRP